LKKQQIDKKCALPLTIFPAEWPCELQAWTKELQRHQSPNVAFTGHFVWGGEAIL
jgi:hypothetical protein